MKPTWLAALALTFVSATFAGIIGTNVPAMPLTADRVASLPDWKEYFEHSRRQRQVDRDFLQAELREHHLAQATRPRAAHNASGLGLDNPANWYAGGEARHIADVVVSFQTPAGGWSKNTDYVKNLRQPGEMFGVDNGSVHLGVNDFDAPDDPGWSYVGTFDNDATTTELNFLARVVAANTNGTAGWENSFLRGLEYVFAAQYPNGGWPQVWPLQGGYHDGITLNDDAMLNILELLQDVAGGQDAFAFVPPAFRARASASFARGVECLLAAQVVVGGKRTVWCQQYDAITLQPASARNYEMPSLASSESATIVLFLMQLPHPNSNVVAAVQGACAWFEKTRIEDRAYQSTGADGRRLIAARGAGPIWSRYYEIGTDKPIFGDRDKTIHDNVDDLSKERRNGYGWYRDTPKRVLEHYRRWAQEHP